MRIGAVPVPILFLLAPPEVKHILTDCEPKAVITSIEFLPTIQQAVTDLAWKPEIILIGSVTEKLVRNAPCSVLVLRR